MLTIDAQDHGMVGISNEQTLVATMHGTSDGGALNIMGNKGPVSRAVGAYAGRNGGNLVVFNPNGAMRAAMMSSELGGQVGVMGVGDEPQAVMKIEVSGDAISVTGNSDQPGVRMMMRPQGGAVQVFDHDGEVRASLP